MDKIWEGYVVFGGLRKDFGFSLSEMGSYYRIWSRGMIWVDYGFKRFWKIGIFVFIFVILVLVYFLEYGKCLIS